MRIMRFLPAIGLAGLVILPGGPSEGQSPRSGGWLTLRLREDLPQGFAIHESATISTMWPAMPCFSNLVLFDPLKPTHSVDTIVGELAERWAWQENYRKLVFFLRRDVRWHDGKPFSSKDVKYTFDLLRETPDAPAKLRLNPRREWYANVEAVDAVDPQTVVFRLKRPQPSLLLMLASGFTPIYAAHVPPATYRTGCVGTGPFKVKDWRKGEFVEYVKNPDYFVKGRPYLDGLRYLIIAERGTATAALQAGRVEVAFPGETPKPIADQLKKAAPQLVVTQVNAGVLDHLTINSRKPPFDNVTVRQALSRAIDRRALIAAVYQGAAVLGASMMPSPYGVWGLLEPNLRTLPGYGERSEQASEGRGSDPPAPGLPGHQCVRDRGVAACRDRRLAPAGGYAAVGPPANARGVRARRRPKRGGTGRPGRQSLRVLRLRVAPKLFRLLQRGDDALL
jgi:peptide/nickel transport system substrate-binding protein